MRTSVKIKIFLQRYSFAITFFVGIFIGSCYVNAAYYYNIAIPEIYNQNYLAKYADISVNYYSLWKYIIKYRFRDFLIVGIMGLTVLKKYMVSIYLIYLGICAGMLISTAVMYYGFAGILLYLASVLPQYILYGIAIYILYQLFYFNYLNRKNVAVIVMMAVLLVAVGTYMEAYCNPYILKKLYGYLY